MLVTPCENPLQSRQDVARLVERLIQPLPAYFSAGRAQVRLGPNRALYGDPAGLMEGFCRPLWAIAPMLSGGAHCPHLALWQEGIAHGTDPAHPEYWGQPGDYDQRSVESAALGFALTLRPEDFWAPLSPEAKASFVAWLRLINDVKLVDSNWLFFRVLVNLGPTAVIVGSVTGTAR